MKKVLYLITAVVLSNTAFAQEDNKVLTPEEEKLVVETLAEEEAAADTNWTSGGTTGLNMSQVYLSNWAAGGESSVSVTGLVNLFSNYAKKSSTWDNTLDLAYGMLWQGDNAGIKTDDKFDFSSKFGHKASEAWYYSALLNFRTQFAPGYADPFADNPTRISDLLAPGYGLLALGMDYKPSPKFTAFISPVTVKMTIVGDQVLADAGAFGVTAATYDDLGTIITEGENFRQELGGYLKIVYKTDLVENVSLQTKLDLFSNYAVNPQNIDVNWETLISMKINKYLSTTISTQVLYDHDIDIARTTEETAATGIVAGPITQFKEVLAIGFSYKF